MERNDENQPAPVPRPVGATQVGEARDPWWWVERTIWTERMLSRLTNGESVNRVWFSLVDKTYAPSNLASAFQKVWVNGGSAGADAQTVAHFGRQAEAEMAGCKSNYATGRIVRNRCGGLGFPSPAAARSDRWEYRRCETE